MTELNFPCASPESLGIPSRAVTGFLKELEAARLPIHSFILMRHGVIAAEGYAAPYDAQTPHRVYSVSKSLVSAAVGMLITEGRLTLTDRVCTFFLEYLPENPSPYITACTVRDLLVMAGFNETDAHDPAGKDDVRAFFDNGQPKHMPGQIYHYDSMNSVVLSAIVEKIAGMPLVDYLRPLFDALGMSREVRCVRTNGGWCDGGSGFMMTPRDLLRFGQFVMNRGRWQGKQWISDEYMRAATTKQISCFAGGYDMANQGYGYHFRVLKDGGFACYGMGSQFVMMMPACDTVLVTTAGNLGLADPDDIIRDAHYRMLAKCQAEPLPEDEAAMGGLMAASRLTLPLIPGRTDSPVAKAVSGRRYRVEDNIMGFSWVQFDFHNDLCLMSYEKRGAFGCLPIYAGSWGPLVLPEKSAGKRQDVRDRCMRGVSSFAWKGENTFFGMVYLTDMALGLIKLQAAFTPGEVTVMFVKAADGFEDFRDYLAGHAEND